MAGSLREVEDWLNRAEKTLGASRTLVETGYFNDSVSRAYYAMFYAAKAAVVKEGVRTRKHSGVISAFGRIFAKTGRVDPKLHKALTEAFEEREEADYSAGLVVQEGAARERLDAAKAFVGAIRILCQT